MFSFFYHGTSPYFEDLGVKWESKWHQNNDIMQFLAPFWCPNRLLEALGAPLGPQSGQDPKKLVRWPLWASLLGVLI